jgi:hypothetical protein
MKATKSPAGHGRIQRGYSVDQASLPDGNRPRAVLPLQATKRPYSKAANARLAKVFPVVAVGWKGSQY